METTDKDFGKLSNLLGGTLIDLGSRHHQQVGLLYLTNKIYQHSALAPFRKTQHMHFV